VAASVAGESAQLRHPADAAAALQDLRDAGARQTGSLRAVWFNQPFLKDVFHPHQRVILFGKLELTSHGLQMQSPQYEILGDADEEGERREPTETVHTGRIVPIYEKTGQLTAKMQRTLVHQALQSMPGELPDPLPPAVRARQQLIDRARALEQVALSRRGRAVAELNAFRSPAHRRLIFEEFFLFQLGIVLRKRRADSRAQGRAGRRHRRDPRGGAPNPAVQADRRPEDGHPRESSPTCSGRSR
jgi:ATP-dependent DNA helicase RecG